ncbi:hypothetical protein PIB30_064989 [Stylosanthes scabra]|uniref:Zinc finger GRF-type domain-containing protein n=1 Tax=Stylosanthes scabra TaxID=79078 RepID=A0ABU6QMN8_9FABA|nr:hypothetical protein [Stylosanthes scabra]
MATSSSISSSSADVAVPRCHCGMRSPMRTTWRCDYPGRRFYGCAACGGPNSCTFFECFDPVPPKRFVDVIRNLLEANESLSTNNHNMMMTNSELTAALRKTTKKAEELAADVDGMVASNVVLSEDLTTCVVSRRRLRSALVAVLPALIACVWLRVVNN